MYIRKSTSLNPDKKLVKSTEIKAFTLTYSI